jgi:hypothetical protein
MQGWTHSRGKDGIASPGEMAMVPQNPMGFGAGHQLSETNVDAQQYSHRNNLNHQISFRHEHPKAIKNSSLGLIDEKHQSASSITNA